MNPNLPSNPLLQLVPPRAARALDRISAQIWLSHSEIPVRMTEPTVEHLDFQTGTARKTVRKDPPFAWGKLWDQVWFQLDIPPAEVAEKTRYLYWPDQAEATLYVDGEPWYGLDVGHRYAPLPPRAESYWVEAVCACTGIWHPEAPGISPQGSLFTNPTLCYRDDLAWSCYHDFKILLDVLHDEIQRRWGQSAQSAFPGVGYKLPVEECNVLTRRLLRYLDQAVDALDTGGLPSLQKELKKIYKKLPANPLSLKLILTGHAHIDLVWLWPENVGEFKAVHTFATVDRLMDMYPEFRFSYSQPASYFAAARRAPGLLPRIRQRLASGQWEATGACEVESDTLMACGEALARSFMHGQKRFTELQGHPTRTLWLPDVFGYAACLPQLMVQTGVDSFFTTKLTWSSISRFPHSSFVWRGHDGSEVVSHITQAFGYIETMTIPNIRKGEDAYRQSDVHDEFMMPTGYGDGGGGPNEEMCERARRLAKLAGCPRTQWDRIEDFFDRLAKIKEDLPVFQGELYLEYHRGVLTTHASVKEAFRALEVSLQTAEAVRSAMGQGPVPANWWERLIFAQFHDYIPGSSIHEVYLQGLPELREIAGSARNLAKTELEENQNNAVPCLFNPLPVPRFHCHYSAEHKRYIPVVLPPLSGQPVSQCTLTDPRPDVSATPHSLDNGLIHANFDRHGRIKSLAGPDGLLALSHPAAQFALYPDFPHQYPAWDIDRQSLSIGEALTPKVESVVEENCSCAASLVFTGGFGQGSSFKLRYRLVKGSPLLHIDMELDWQEKDALLRMLFPTGYRGRFARFGAPFGSVLRPQWPGTQADEAMWESAGSRWACVSNDSETCGLMLLSENKYGFSSRDGCLGVSLVRSVTCSGEEERHHRSHPREIRRDAPPTPYTDLGKHRIRLAVGSFSSLAPIDRQPALLADLAFQPPIPYQGAAVDAGLLAIKSGPSLHPVWAQPLNDTSWVLRLHETLGQSGEATIQLRREYHGTPVDLSGKELGKPQKTPVIQYQAYGLYSIRIQKG